MEQIKELEQFAGWLDEQGRRLAEQGRQGAVFFEMQRATGLRSAEVLELERWKEDGNGTYYVQLAKREGQRKFRAEELPKPWLEYYASRGQPLRYTYKHYEYDLARAGIFFVINESKRATTSHAARFYYLQARHAEGYNVPELQYLVGHLSPVSTEYYLKASVAVYDKATE